MVIWETVIILNTLKRLQRNYTKFNECWISLQSIFILIYETGISFVDHLYMFLKKKSLQISRLIDVFIKTICP